MRAFGLARGFVAAVAALLSLGAVALATPAMAGWPNSIPAQPLVQAPMRCALGIAPINRRCHVIDFADLGTLDARHWYYAFYATHWADRHGKMDRGFPIFFYLQKPATLRLGMWVDDEPGLAGPSARTPPVRPVVVDRPDGVYMGLTLKAVRGQDNQRLFLLDGIHWKSIVVLYRSDEDNALIAAAMPKHCEGIDDGSYDWANFRYLLALKTNSGGDPCGTITAGLEVRQGRVYLTDAVATPAMEAAQSSRRP
jgi:hypothetical protein